MYNRSASKVEYAPYSAIRQVLIGHLYEILGQTGAALDCYAKGCLVDQRRLMSCIVQQFLVCIDKVPIPSADSAANTPHRGAPSIPPTSPMHMKTLASRLTPSSNVPFADSSKPAVCQFLTAANAISPLIGLQAYRLVLELIYRDLVLQLECVIDKENTHLSKELELGSFRTFPGSHRNVGGAQQKSARNR